MGTRVRRVLVILPVICTVLIATAIGGLVVLEDQRQSRQVAAADDVAEDFLSDVGAFQSSVAKQVSASATADPGAARTALRRAVTSPPTLRSTSSYGMANSSAYAEAQQVEATFLAPYRRLSTTLATADTAKTFIDAARKVLALRASDYLDTTLLSSSAQLRSRLIPAFVAARDAFDEVKVPAGQSSLAAKVHDAVQYVIDRATTLADRIDAGVSFSFTYDAQYQAALDAVDDYAATVEGDLGEAINAITADAP